MALDRTLLLTVALLAACNGDDADTDAVESLGPPPLGEPIADLPPAAELCERLHAEYRAACAALASDPYA